MGNFVSIFFLEIQNGPLGDQPSETMGYDSYSVVFFVLIFHRGTEVICNPIDILDTCPDILAHFRGYILRISKGFHIPSIHFRVVDAVSYTHLRAHETDSYLV